MYNTYKGFFKPANPSKYIGDPTNIIYRSLWELRVMKWLDNHPDVIQWGSEELIIPYISPFDNRVHRYFPDFFVKKRNANKEIETVIIEVKPENQRKPPKKQQKKTKKYIQEVYTWGINSAKWKAAENYCGERGWKFKILSEKELGILNA